MSVDFDRERAWWDEMAANEETDHADEAVNRALRWREIDRRLDGIETILDIGGGTGAFSIPLARRGYAVTHLDLSPQMLKRARAKAEAEGLANITFVEGNAADLARYGDASFDLVLNMDGAISFCGSEAPRALRETCRVARRWAIITVLNRGRLAGRLADLCVTHLGCLGPMVDDVCEDGSFEFHRHSQNIDLGNVTDVDYFGPIQSYTAADLRRELEELSIRIERCTALGTFAHSTGVEASRRLMAEPEQRERFLDLCERFDTQIMPDGPGTRARAGVIAVVSK